MKAFNTEIQIETEGHGHVIDLTAEVFDAPSHP